MDVPDKRSFLDQRQWLRELEENLPTLPVEEWVNAWEKLREVKDDTSPRIRVLRFQLLLHIDRYVQQVRSGELPNADEAITRQLQQIVEDEF